MSTRIALAAFCVSLYHRWAVQTASYLSFVRLKPSPLLHSHERLISRCDRTAIIDRSHYRMKESAFKIGELQITEKHIKALHRLTDVANIKRLSFRVLNSRLLDGVKHGTKRKLNITD